MERGHGGAQQDSVREDINCGHSQLHGCYATV